jgi:hypothetical protein
MPRIRFKVDDRAVPASAVARHLGVSEPEFQRRAPELIAKHGFPRPVPLFGTFDLTAVDRWLAKQNPALFVDEPCAGLAVDARMIDMDARIAKIASNDGDD